MKFSNSDKNVSFIKSMVRVCYLLGTNGGKMHTAAFNWRMYAICNYGIAVAMGFLFHSMLVNIKRVLFFVCL